MAVSRGRRSDFCLGDNTGRAHSTGAGSQRRGRDAKGDKRIVLVDGEVVGAINRLPGEGEIRSNLAVGGSAEKTELTEREREICAAMGPELKRRGLIFVGIDVIGGEWLTEINVTSPTGIVAIERFDGTDVAGLIWDAIERKLPLPAQV